MIFIKFFSHFTTQVNVKAVGIFLFGMILIASELQSQDVITFIDEITQDIEAERFQEAQEKAEKLQRLVKENAEILGIHYGTALLFVAGTHRSLRNYNKSEQIYLDALNEFSSKEKFEDSIDLLLYEMLLEGYGILKLAKEDYGAADSLYRLSTKLFNARANKIKNPYSNSFFVNDFIARMGSWGMINMDMGNYVKSDSLFSLGLTWWKHVKLEDRIKLLHLLNNYGSLEYTIGNWERADSLFQAAVNLMDESNPAASRYYLNLFELSLEQDKFHEAWNLLNKAKRNLVALDRELHVDYVYYLNYQGKYHLKLQQLPLAVYTFKEVLSLMDSLDFQEKELRIIVLHNLAFAHKGLNQYTQADSLYRMSLDLLGDSLNVYSEQKARTLNNMGSLYHELGLESLKKGDTTQANNQFREAIKWMKKAIGLVEKDLGSNHYMTATSIGNLASIYADLKEYDLADSLYQASIEKLLRTYSPIHSNVYATHYLRAMNFWSQGRKKPAKKLFRQVLDSAFRFYQLHHTGLSEQEKFLLLYSRINNTKDKLISVSWEETNQGSDLPIFAFDYLLKIQEITFREAMNVRKHILHSDSPELLAQYYQWKLFRKTLANAQMLSLEERRKRGLNLIELSLRTDSMEKVLNNQNQVIKDKNTIPAYTWQDIQKHLKPHQAVVAYMRFNRHTPGQNTSNFHYAALVLRPEDPHPRWIKLCAEDKFSDILALDFKDPKGYIKHKGKRRELYMQLWQPLDSMLEDAREIFLVPDGLLSQVAFGLLTSDGVETLMDRYDLNFLTRISNAMEKPGKIGRKSIALWGAADFTFKSGTTQDVNANISLKVYRGGTHKNPWNSLPGTEKEVTSLNDTLLKQSWETQIYTHADFNEKNISFVIQIKPSTVLHLATHGFFQPWEPGLPKNPMHRSGLILSGANYTWVQDSTYQPLPADQDGIWTSYEITGLDLSGTNLVVLSACDTGLGDIHTSEGVLGLQKAFRMAGVRYVLMSLWKVPDEENPFIPEFYKQLNVYQDPQQAFRKTQQILSRSNHDAINWAGFVLVK